MGASLLHVIAARALKCEADRADPNDKNFRSLSGFAGQQVTTMRQVWTRSHPNVLNDLDPGTITGESQYSVFHLIEQPIDGICSAGATTGLRCLLHGEEKGRGEHLTLAAAKTPQLHSAMATATR